jgi:serine/threonine protein kinase
MNGLEQYVGQVLDDKYRLERLLGQGGMGAVYLATHLGTDRYVALKLIAPQFMRNAEFVERFKREARAAGRLRHPNVVDVTDFGFARTANESVAYLVMEYLDGCTLSDVLAEEDRLPLYWVVDIIEQVCAAVHEAHQQGIVHRDLKPDNIWLEPNGLGGYRVKVLDFGIAKLGEVSLAMPEAPSSAQRNEDSPTLRLSAKAVAAPAASGIAELELRQTALAPDDSLETETLIQPSAKSDENVQATRASEDGDQTRLFQEGAQVIAGPSRPATDPLATAGAIGLTRVGAVLGTPLYMSPEQCRGERLDARSDVYSLGVIAYQMLAGTPPFTGDTDTIISAHTNSQPAPLRQHNGKLPKRVSRVIMSALEKDPTTRPPTAIAFAGDTRQCRWIGRTLPARVLTLQRILSGVLEAFAAGAYSSDHRHLDDGCAEII